jgi:hypothetical protein
MRRFRRSVTRCSWRLTLFLAVVALPACGGGDGPEVLNNVDTYTPNFTFVWDEINASGAFIEPEHRFSLQTNDAGQQSGTFTDSTEELNGQLNSLTGTFRNRDLSLTIDRSGTSVQVTGRFLTDDTIQMREPTRTYSVRRNNNP